MIKRIQVLWYLKKEDFTNYCLDFKEYTSHKLEGYEICDVDEDLIYDLCEKDPDKLELIGFFQSENELKKHISDSITSQEYELEIGSPELEEKIQDALKTIDFTGEDYYISCGGEDLGSPLNKIASWFDTLKDQYNSSSRHNLWVLWVTGYDVYELKPSGKVLTYVLSDILNLNESYFNDLIPDKGILTKEQWNNVLKEMFKRNKLNLGLCRVV